MTKILFPVYLDNLSVGGVTEFVTQLLKNFKDDVKVYGLNGECKETTVSNPHKLKKRSLALLGYFKFIGLARKSDFVFLNTSIKTKALVRDVFYSLLCTIFNIRFVVFIHGWDSKINNSSILTKLMRFAFKSANNIFVLSIEFKDNLLSFGLPENKISIYSTMVDEDLVNYIESQSHRKEPSSQVAFLFVGRIIKEKGIYEAVDAFHEYSKNTDYEVLFNIAGDGPELNNLITYVNERNIKNINFIGYIFGIEKYNLLIDSDVFLFPSYSEGMPISVLEAMAASNYIITTKVGAIKDFFVDNQMGISLPKCETGLIIDALYNLNIHKINNVAVNNRTYAFNNFRSSIVVENILDTVLKQRDNAK